MKQIEIQLTTTYQPIALKIPKEMEEWRSGLLLKREGETLSQLGQETRWIFDLVGMRPREKDMIFGRR